MTVSLTSSRKPSLAPPTVLPAPAFLPPPSPDASAPLMESIIVTPVPSATVCFSEPEVLPRTTSLQDFDEVVVRTLGFHRCQHPSFASFLAFFPETPLVAFRAQPTRRTASSSLKPFNA